MESIAELAATVNTLKSNNDIRNLNKNDAIQYSIEITNNVKKLMTAMFDTENGVIVKMQRQLDPLDQQNEINQKLLIKMNNLEKQQIQTDQYARKETIEIKGLGENIPDRDIESKVVDVLNSIKDDDDTQFTREDIHACHRLKNKSIVICKFVSRRRMRATISNRKKLKGKDLTQIGVQGKLVIYESMSFHYKNLHWKCTQLKKAQVIKDCWFMNGKYKIVQSGETEAVVIVDSENLSATIEKTIVDIDALCEEWKNKPFATPRQE